MSGDLITKCAYNTQYILYDRLNDFSTPYPVAGRFVALPVALVDVGIDILKLPIAAIEFLGLAAINLVGAAFSNDYTLKKSLMFVDATLSCLVNTPCKMATAPFKCAYQFFAILIDPVHVNSINFNFPTFHNRL
ncbi:MAG: hypothetical protein LW832_06555 [Parachlamydia sp.]|nr:hypothetical protein [Parachlamydia sp.]